MNEAPLSLQEAVQLGAVDSVVFSRTFFPKTFRQATPLFHRRMWDLLDSHSRYVNMQVYRDGAKTTLLRTYTAKRIAYNTSRTILYIGKSQGHAARSLQWLQKQIEFNQLYAGTFGLRKGSKWNTDEMEIIHGTEGNPIWITGMGITGSVRGLNFDDYRPDLIIVDDVVDEENSASLEGREKISNLILGAVKESLAPATESPDAKMAILQTPLDPNDISQQALRDPQFVSARFGCWTEETENLPIEDRKSNWEERYPTATLQEEYAAAAARNRLSVFAREKECKLITLELSAFKEEWLQFFGVGEEEPEPLLDEMFCVLVIDPVPPPSDNALAKGLPKGDYEALGVIGKYKGKLYVLETSYRRGHNPSWTVAEFFRLAQRWRVRKVVVEAVAYQRTLAWLLREAMKRAGTYYAITEYIDKRKKELRIHDGLHGVSHNRQLFVRRRQTVLIDQYIRFSESKKLDHDDVLEVVAIGATELQNGGFNLADGGYHDESGIEDLAYAGACP